MAIHEPAYAVRIMAAPVTRFGSDGAGLVRFFMPADYLMESLPEPNGKRVSLVPVPAEWQAVARLSGLARADRVERWTADLMAFVERQGLHGVGRTSLARYNPLWTPWFMPWFMRRNEVWTPMERVSAPADKNSALARLGQLA